MAAPDRTVQPQQDTYDLLVKEAARRGVEPEAVADELLRAGLAAAGRDDLEEALDVLAKLRAASHRPTPSSWSVMVVTNSTRAAVDCRPSTQNLLVALALNDSRTPVDCPGVA
jgi:hypothetical protein